MANSSTAHQVLFLYYCRQVLYFPLAAYDIYAFFREKSDSGRVISPVFKAFEPFQNNVDSVPGAYIADYSAHG
jgi:hypothetical protein